MLDKLTERQKVMYLDGLMVAATLLLSTYIFWNFGVYMEFYYSWFVVGGTYAGLYYGYRALARRKGWILPSALSVFDRLGTALPW